MVSAPRCGHHSLLSKTRSGKWVADKQTGKTGPRTTAAHGCIVRGPWLCSHSPGLGPTKLPSASHLPPQAPPSSHLARVCDSCSTTARDASSTAPPTPTPTPMAVVLGLLVYVGLRTLEQGS